METSFAPELISDLENDAVIRDLWSKSIHDRERNQTFTKTKDTYDFIIIGAGTAGCVIARELIYNIPNINILVLEAGPPRAQVNDISSLPCRYLQILRARETDWGYSVQKQTMPSSVDPTKEVENKGFFYPRAKVWGGCSSVNGMIYMRGQKTEYNDWAAQGPGYEIWDWDHCLEVFKAMENNSQENPDKEFKNLHGFEGLLHVEGRGNKIHEISQSAIVAAMNLGIPYNSDFNGAKQNGVGKYQYTTKDGKRYSLADSYLASALEKVELLPGSKGIGSPGKISAVNVKSVAHVLNIIWDQEKDEESVAIGVRYFCDGIISEAFIAPKGEVLLCAGVINSAQILMLSGIGPKENLETNNVKVRKDLPVGQNLWDHPVCPVSAVFSNKNLPGASELAPYCSGFEIGIFHKANPEGKVPSLEDFSDERPDLQVYVFPAIIDQTILDSNTATKDPVTDVQGLTAMAVLNIPSSAGYLELASNNPFQHPKIYTNYYDKPDDLYRMMSSLKLVHEVIKQPPLSTIWGAKEIGTNGEMSDEDWEKYIRQKASTSFHPCGTVKMAPESKGGVVNHRLQVYGTKNLRVIDASIFPSIPSGNTNAPTAMVAWRACRLIEEDYRNKK